MSEIRTVFTGPGRQRLVRAETVNGERRIVADGLGTMTSTADGWTVRIGDQEFTGDREAALAFARTVLGH